MLKSNEHNFAMNTNVILLLGQARTGTGKTLSFALPTIELLKKSPEFARGRKPRAIIMTPTRELASQV